MPAPDPDPGFTGVTTFYEAIFIDDFVESPKTPFPVIPAKAGIQSFQQRLDSARDCAWQLAQSDYVPGWNLPRTSYGAGMTARGVFQLFTIYTNPVMPDLISLPRKVLIQGHPVSVWIPAFAGMTRLG